MDGKIRRSAPRVLALVLAFALCLSMVPVAAQADGNGTYREVTENLTDWSGEYLLVYEADDGTAYVFNGSLGTLDSRNNCITATISNGTITTDRAYSVTVESVVGGYVIKAASGSYIYHTTDSGNGLSTTETQSTAARYPITFNVTSEGIDIQLQPGPYMRFNASGSEMRFRYYKSGTYTNQQPVTLYRLEDGGSTTPTVAAPSATPQAGTVASGTSITLSTETEDATIYYTLDGTDPADASNTSRQTYSDSNKPTINADCTLKAVAELNGTYSALQELQYTVSTGTEEPPTAPIADGDQVVIYAPAYNKALSGEYSGYNNIGTNITVGTDGTLSGFTTEDVWTVIKNDDDTWSFQYDGQKLAMGDSFASMPLGAKNDKWVLESAGNGCWYVENTVRNAYIEWFESRNYWSAYHEIASGSEGMFALRFYNVNDIDVPEPSEPVVPIQEDDVVGIYLPSEQLVITTTENGSGLAGAAATLDNDELTTAAENAEFTVLGDNTEGFQFVADGKYLTSGETGNSLTLSTDSESEYSYWTLEANETSGWYIKNKAAVYNSNSQYIEYYSSRFTTFGLSSGGNNYTFQFYPIADSSDTPAEEPIAEGDTVVIYAPSNGMALSATVKNRYYPIGVEVKVVEDVLTGYGETEIWTVGSSDGAWTFTSNSGEKLGMSSSTSYSTTYPGAGANETWALESAGEGLYYIRNVNRNTYLWWDEGNTDWTTRDSSKTAVTFVVVEPPEEEPGEELPSGLVVLASPVTGATVGAGETITLTTMEGATIYYTVNGGNPSPDDGISLVYSAPLTVGEGQVPAPTDDAELVIRAIAVIPATGEAEAQTSEVYTFTYRAKDAIDGYNLYFGQLHSHTDISDGTGSVEDAFAHASSVPGLDFLAVTDHSNSFDNHLNASVDLGADLLTNEVSEEWVRGHEAAEDATTDDFVGIYGFEMTWSGGFGHINTFNTTGFESRDNDEFDNNPTGHVNYYNKLVEVESSLSQFNHPGTTFGDFGDFAYYSQSYDARINLIEVGNGEGAIGSGGYFPSYEYYTRALDKGWHVAPTNNQDNHKGGWGDSNTARSVVLANELTEEAIYDAIANHRVYATEDNDLSIRYSLNGNVMGSIIGEQGSVQIVAEISDPTDSADMTVEVIVNGGLVAASQTLSGGRGTVNFNFEDNEYSYYYLRVTQADRQIAVTAPVWTGESINAGISKTECDTALVVMDEEVTISSELFNNSNLDMTVVSLVYAVDGGEIYRVNDFSSIGVNGVISTGDTATVSFPYAFTTGGPTTVNVTMEAWIGETEYTFTSVLQLTVMNESLVTRVLVDGTHWNDYVNGYYANNMGNFIEIAAGMNAQVTIQQPDDTMTADDLDGVSLLVISAPLKYTSDYTGDAEISTFEPEFIELVKNYVNGGGTVIICGLADYQDANNHENGTYTTYTQINNLLEEIGTTMRVNDDELIDQDENGGQPYRLYFDDFNYGSTDEAVQAALAGLENSGKVYSSYSGCSVSIGNGIPIVFGHDTTYSINSKAPTQGHGKPVQSYSNEYDPATAVVTKGNVVSLATEKVGAGRVYLGGTVWMSNFEVTSDGSDGNDYGDASYANKTIITNILSGILKDPEVSTIAQAREGNPGDMFTVEGTVVAGSVSPNAFFDCIYIQDETGAICLHPVNNTVGTFQVGQTVRATGYRGDYQGDVQLGQVISAEVIDENIAPIPPREFSLAEANNYDEKGGYLAKVSGTVKSVESASGQISSVILTDGTTDFRLLFNNYIGYSDASSTDITTFVEEGAEISAVGVIYKDPDGTCLRVRDLSEVELVTEDVPDVPIIPGRPVTPSRPSDDDEPDDGPSEPFIDVTERDWFFDAIVYVYNEGMMSGVEANVFNPNGNMTRAMFWTVLARIDGVDTNGGDVWYARAREWAVTEGVSDGTNPDGLITREQLATMLYRYAGEPETDGTLEGFSDAGSVSEWAYDALAWAVENGIVTGMGDGTLDPQGNATRAQAATMFMRYMSVVK